MTKTFGQLVREARGTLWTQAELSSRLADHGVTLSQPMVSLVETGGRVPDTWEALAFVLALRPRLDPVEALSALGLLGEEPVWAQRIEAAVARIERAS